MKTWKSHKNINLLTNSPTNKSVCYSTCWNANYYGMKWLREANRQGARPGEEESSIFLLPAHIDANYTPLPSAEAIANHFAQLSQEYTTITYVPKINTTVPCDHMDIQEHRVYERMKDANKTDSVPEDIPSFILWARK